jgi:hypothetical protein
VHLLSLLGLLERVAWKKRNAVEGFVFSLDLSSFGAAAAAEVAAVAVAVVAAAVEVLLSQGPDQEHSLPRDTRQEVLLRPMK